MLKKLIALIVVAGVSGFLLSGCGWFKSKYDIRVQNMTTESATFVFDGDSYTIEPLRIMDDIKDVKEDEYSWEAQYKDELGQSYTQNGSVKVNKYLYFKIYPTGVTVDEWVK